MRAFLLAAAFALVAGSAHSATAPVQVKVNIATSNTVSTTLDSAPTAGNTLMVVLTRGGSVGLTSVTGGGATWTQGCSPSVGGTRYYVYTGTTDGSSSTVTALFGGTALLGLFVIEGNSNYSFEACGAIQSTSGTQSTISSGALSNVSANALMVAVATQSGTTAGAPTGGYTSITTGTAAVIGAYLAVSSVASQFTTWSSNTSAGYGAMIVSFAEADGGGGGGGGLAPGGLLLRGVGAALWHRLWPFGGRAPILGVQVDVGAIRADHVQPQQQHDAGDVEKRREPQDVIDRVHLFSHLRSFRPERSDLSRTRNIAQVGRCWPVARSAC